MKEKINCLLDRYHRINVRIAILKDIARATKDLIVREAEIESRKNAAKQP